MPTHQDLINLFTLGWDRLWTDVKAHPEIVGWRETHAHVLLGHYLLNEIDKPGSAFRLWDDVELRFDEHSGVKTMNTYLAWRFVASEVRPDIALATRPGLLAGSDDRSLLIEMKCIRTIWKRNRFSGDRYM